MIVKEVGSSFTRPSNADAYADGDVVANSTTAGSVTPLSWDFGKGGHCVRIRIEKTDQTDVANADFTLRLFSSSPTPGAGDNAAITHTISDHLGTIDVGAMVAGTDDAYVTINRGETGFVDGVWLPTGKVYGLLEANAAYVPASAEVFRVYLTVVQ